ncbi:outer membrane beta-barrel protein [Mongoliibacter ruber]|uniref:Outer membrane protein with beta-barrel domain n=1 Tax=Mongoliibacter ruber TaxID=1750599 RepID=A0A2T0WLN3_9BACT|nr:outer membrane beta-barrel protein [Mongoliibacter ruber]PRY87606.1 outer membrane protein with beta-barrel domain [Mongoliibacter ruber]
MKKAVLVILGLLCGFSLAAQTEKGKFLVGAGTTLGISDGSYLMSTAFTSSTFEFEDGTTITNRQTSFIFSPKAGYFFFDHFAAGIDFAISHTNSTNTTTSDFNIDSKINSFGAGPFVRYYIPKGKILPFAELSSLFGTRNQKAEVFGADSETRYSVSSIGGGLGVAILLGEKSSVDLVASYNSTNLKEQEDNFKNTQNTLGLKIGFTIFL